MSWRGMELMVDDATAQPGAANLLMRPVPLAVPGTLSDLAVSPFALPISLLRGEVRVAWIGRTSTQDRQDPRQSLVRQLDRCRTALPASWVIVAHFYDVESGRMELERRGRGSGYERFNIPIARDGGITDLLDHARAPARLFDVVICESTARVARRMFEGLSVERQLEQVGVALFAWNESIKLDGGRAQQMLQRRINQAVAEYEVLNTLEQSWGGLCTHVREGWNIGKPPYGYTGRTYRHPNPIKAEKGLVKTRLEPDGARAETVTLIATWRYYQGLTYDEIAQRLNVDLQRHPPPEPPGKDRALGYWAKCSVFEILRNPKYTGFQVFNRRASRSRSGKVNGPELWVWSPEPAHEPLIPKWMFDELATSSSARRGSRWGNDKNRHPQARRTYALRGMVFCHCGKRMTGSLRHDRVYYSCEPRDGAEGGRHSADQPHTKGVYIREEVVLAAVAALLGTYVFGRAQGALATNTAETMHAEQSGKAGQDQAPALMRHIHSLERRQRNLLDHADALGLTEPFAMALRHSYNALDTARTAVATVDQLEALTPLRHRTHGNERNVEVSADDVSARLHRAPAALLRRLFEITSLAVQLDDCGGHAVISIVIPAPAGVQAICTDTMVRCQRGLRRNFADTAHTTSYYSSTAGVRP